MFGKVHEGFKGAADSLWTDVQRTVGEVGVGKRLWITGHSLGAAIAVLVAARFAAENRAVEGLYLLGQPRAGDNAFVKAVDEKLPNRCFRIVNSIDPVPRVPPVRMGFLHGATLVYVTAAGQVVVGASRWKMITDSIAARFKTGFNFKSVGIGEHGSDRYVEVLQRAVGSSPAG